MQIDEGLYTLYGHRLLLELFNRVCAYFKELDLYPCCMRLPFQQKYDDVETLHLGQLRELIESNNNFPNNAKPPTGQPNAQADFGIKDWRNMFHELFEDADVEGFFLFFYTPYGCTYKKSSENKDEVNKDLKNGTESAILPRTQNCPRCHEASQKDEITYHWVLGCIVEYLADGDGAVSNLYCPRSFGSAASAELIAMLLLYTSLVFFRGMPYKKKPNLAITNSTPGVISPRLLQLISTDADANTGSGCTCECGCAGTGVCDRPRGPWGREHGEPCKCLCIHLPVGQPAGTDPKRYLPISPGGANLECRLLFDTSDLRFLPAEAVDVIQKIFLQSQPHREPVEDQGERPHSLPLDPALCNCQNHHDLPKLAYVVHSVDFIYRIIWHHLSAEKPYNGKEVTSLDTWTPLGGIPSKGAFEAMRRLQAGETKEDAYLWKLMHVHAPPPFIRHTFAQVLRKPS